MQRQKEKAQEELKSQKKNAEEKEKAMQELIKKMNEEREKDMKEMQKNHETLMKQRLSEQKRILSEGFEKLAAEQKKTIIRYTSLHVERGICCMMYGTTGVTVCGNEALNTCE